MEMILIFTLNDPQSKDNYQSPILTSESPSTDDEELSSYYYFFCLYYRLTSCLLEVL